MDRLARLAELLGRWSDLNEEEIAEVGPLIDLSITDEVDGEQVLYWTDDRLAELAELLSTTVDTILDDEVDDQAVAALEVLAAISARRGRAGGGLPWACARVAAAASRPTRKKGFMRGSPRLGGQWGVA